MITISPRRLLSWLFKIRIEKELLPKHHKICSLDAACEKFVSGDTYPAWTHRMTKYPSYCLIFVSTANSAIDLNFCIQLLDSPSVSKNVIKSSKSIFLLVQNTVFLLRQALMDIAGFLPACVWGWWEWGGGWRRMRRDKLGLSCITEG